MFILAYAMYVDTHIYYLYVLFLALLLIIIMPQWNQRLHAPNFGAFSYLTLTTGFLKYVLI